MRKLVVMLVCCFPSLSCNLPLAAMASRFQSPTAPPASLPPPTLSPAFTLSPAVTATLAVTSSATITPTTTFTPTPSETPAPTDSSTPAGTPTPQVAVATSIAKTACLYGPNPVYLYMWGLEQGGTAQVYGRDYSGTWLWVQPMGTKFYCWVWAPAVTVSVAVKSIPVVYPPLPTNPRVAPPRGVTASRNGSTVTIQWSAAPPAVGLAYLVEAEICRKGNLLDVVYSTTGLSYALSDDRTCSQHSSGQVRVLDKLGYSTPVKVSWP